MCQCEEFWIKCIYIYASILNSERIFHVGKYLELQFEFKTSELNGVLLSVAEPVGFPALSIEMHNGRVSAANTFIVFT